MDAVIECIIELVPDFFSEFWGEKCIKQIKARVPNRFLRGILYTLCVIAVAALGVGLAFGVILLIGSIIY